MLHVLRIWVWRKLHRVIRPKEVFTCKVCGEFVGWMRPWGPGQVGGKTGLCKSHAKE